MPLPVLLLLSVLLAAPAPQEVPSLDRDAIQARVDALEGADTEAKRQQLARYREALETLAAADAARAEAESFRRDATEAPARLESLRAELAQAPAELDPSAADGLGVEALEARSTQAEADRATAHARVEELASVREQRTARTAAIPEQLADARRELADRLEQLPLDDGPLEAAPRDALVAAEAIDLSARIARLEAEQAAYEALRDVLPLRRERARRRLARAEREAAFWRERLAEARRAEAEAAVAEAERRREEIVRRFPALGSLARDNRQLAARRSGDDGLPERIARAKRLTAEVQALRAEVQRRFVSMERRNVSGVVTEGLALTLRRDHDWLPPEQELEAAQRETLRRLSSAQVDLVEVEDELADFADVDRLRRRLFDELAIDAPDDALVEVADDLLRSRQALLRDVRVEYDALVAALWDLVQARLRHGEAVAEYRAYIDERILWVRGVGPNPLGSLLELPVHVVEFARDTDWSSATAAAADGIVGRSRRPFVPALAALLLVAGPYLRRKRREMGEKVRSYRTDHFFYTLRACVQSVLLALPLPLLALFLAEAFESSSHELVRAAGSALGSLWTTFLVLECVRHFAKPRGLVEAHFRWPARSAAHLRRELRWFAPAFLLLSAVAHTLDRHPVTRWSDSIGRVAFVAAMVGASMFLHRLLRADDSVAAEVADENPTLWSRTRSLGAALAVVLPLALAVASVAGYAYLALQFEARLRTTLGLGLGLLLANALLLRWLFLTRRRAAIEQARARARARSEDAEDDGDGSVDEDSVDIPTLDAQTRRLFRSGIAVAALAGVYMIWSAVLPALQGLDRVQLLPRPAILDVENGRAIPPSSSTADAGGSAEPAPAEDASTGSASPSLSGPIPGLPASGAGGETSSLGLPAILTLADVLLATIFLVLTTVAARNLPALLELTLLQRLPLDAGARFAIATIVRYLILILGVSAVSGALGLSWEKIQWLAAALTFGLAFGLQEIFANFVSGVIILLERPIRVGDLVTVGGTEGRVTRLRMRATTIQDWDRREYLIPNKEFITGTVINWTLTDPVTRIVIPVGIAYGSDTKKARELLHEVSRSDPQVLDDPAPSAIFRGFGGSSLDFELRIFIANRDYWSVVIDRMHSEIDFAFREAGIEIAFPQRDLHLRSLPDGMGFEVAPREDGGGGDGASG